MILNGGKSIAKTQKRNPIMLSPIEQKEKEILFSRNHNFFLGKQQQKKWDDIDS